MTHNTSPQAATRREQSRQVDGRFGFQHHSEADISLSSRGLTEELRQAIMANQPLVQLDTRGDDKPPVILENPQNYPFTVGEYADWAVATDEEVRRYEDHHNQLYDQEDETQERHDQARHNIQEELQDLFSSQGREYVVKTVDYDRKRHDLVAMIDIGNGQVRPWAVGNAQTAEHEDPAYRPLDKDDQSFGTYSWTVSNIRRDNIGGINCGWQQTEREHNLDNLGDNHEFDTWSLRYARSPWGTVQDAEATGSPHIAFVYTDSHGGFKVSQEANKLIPAPLRKRSGWYEEDAERAHVIAAFPTATREGTGATASSLYRSAVDALHEWEPHKATKAGFIE